MNLSTQPHPAIHRLRSAHDLTVTRIHQHLKSGYAPPPPQHKPWAPKYPGINWPDMQSERGLTEAEWRATGFPFLPLPQTVQGVLKAVCKFVVEDCPILRVPKWYRWLCWVWTFFFAHGVCPSCFGTSNESPIVEPKTAAASAIGGADVDTASAT